MKPVFDEVYDQAYVPVEQNEITFQEGLVAALPPLREFMMAQVREKDLMMFMEMSGQGGCPEPGRYSALDFDSSVSDF